MLHIVRGHVTYRAIPTLSHSSSPGCKPFAERILASSTDTSWMKAGAIGPCPSLNTEQLPTMMILSANKLAVLLDENYFSEFEEKVNQDSNIETVFIVTDYEAGYRTMIQSLAVENTYQLYRDYLDNFRINQGRKQV